MDSNELTYSGAVAPLPSTRADASPLRPTSWARSPQATTSSPVTFDRRELREIFNLYGQMVARGEWRDYAIDFNPQHAVFSVFRRTAESPLFKIVKDPRLARKQGAYCVIAATGAILRRGHDLSRILAAIEPKPRFRVV